MSGFIEPRIIRFSPKSLLRIALPLLALVALSLIFNFDSWRKASPVTLWFLGGVAATLVVLAVLMRTRYFLELAPSGLVQHDAGGARRMRWQDIEEIGVLRRSANHVPIGEAITIKLKPGAAPAVQETLSKVNGYHYSIYSSFEEDTDTIVATLQQWKDHHSR